MKLLDIAEVSRLSGQPASALRFYEEKKLIHSIGRRGLKRLFEPGILERRIKHMTAMRDGLRHAAECPAPSHMECPKFKRLVHVAAKGHLSPSENTPRRKRRK